MSIRPVGVMTKVVVVVSFMTAPNTLTTLRLKWLAIVPFKAFICENSSLAMGLSDDNLWIAIDRITLSVTGEREER